MVFTGVHNSAPEADANVVVEDVQLTIGGNRRLHHPLCILRLRDIPLDKDGLSTPLPNNVYRLLPGPRPDIGSNNLGAFLGKKDRRRPSDPW